MAEYATLQSFAVEKSDFNVAVGLVVQTMLQDPEFLYRIERGTPAAGAAGTFRLSASRSPRGSATSSGEARRRTGCSTPPPTGQLDSKDQIRAAAVRLLGDPRAQDRVDRFHALWLGFHQLPHPVDLTQAFRTETGALIRKVVFEDHADYFQLFTSTQTYANAMLVANYGLPATPPASGYAWVSYAGTGRQGHPLPGRGALGGREVRRHQPDPAGNLRPEPAALRDHRASAAHGGRGPEAHLADQQLQGGPLPGALGERELQHLSPAARPGGLRPRGLRHRRARSGPTT